MADNKMIIRKGCEVEVSSDEDGFDGAWYVATLVDIVDKTDIEKNKTEYLVRYDTLYEEENLNENLWEMVDPRFVRPVPPPMAVEEFKVGDVVDAYHKDGWWIGVVNKVIINNGGRKYLVSFENPTEEVEFQKGLLRFHVDWVDSCWKLPPNKKTQEHESVDIHTAESNNDVPPGFTTPSGPAKPTDLENPNTRAAKKRNQLQQYPESNSKMIGAVTCNFKKTRSRTVNSVGKNSRSQASTGGKRKKTVEVPVMEKSGSQAITQDSPAFNAVSNFGNLMRRLATNEFTFTLGKIMETSKTGDGQMVNDLQKGSSRCKRDLLDNNDRSSNAPVPLSQAIVSNGGTNNEKQVWPFVKKSFFWGTIESMELLQMQKPHFSPLKKMKEGCREGYAIGHMVTFENIIRDVLNYQPSSPIEKINNSLELLDELEPHGFDVSAVKGRLNTFLSSKVKVGDLKNELKKFENDIEICNVEKRTVEEELNELEVKIQELQEMKVRKVKMKDVKDEDIKRLQSNVDLVANQITEAELAIEKLAASPL